MCTCQLIADITLEVPEQCILLTNPWAGSAVYCACLKTHRAVAGICSQHNRQGAIAITSCCSVYACDSHSCIALLCLQAALSTLVVLCLHAKLSGQGFEDVYYLTLTHFVYASHHGAEFCGNTELFKTLMPQVEVLLQYPC